MKKYPLSLLALFLGVGVLHAQVGGGGAKFDAAMIKLFGGNSAFSATMETHATLGGDATIMPGKIYVLDGKSRFEMNLEDMTGGGMPPDAMTHMRAMGMTKITAITRPDKQLAYVLYPDLKSYAENPINDPSATNTADSFKLETTELGKETVDGHSCVKNKDVVTDDQGNKHESTVWNATDLKNFPVKIEMSEGGQTVTMVYRDVKLSKPDASLFEPPTGYTHYDSMQAMMQHEMMKHMGGGTPPAQ